MARYFFHVANGQFAPDNACTECANAQEVRSAAIEAAGDMIHEQGVGLWKTGRRYMFVCDEANNTLLRLAFEKEDLTGQLGDMAH